MYYFLWFSGEIQTLEQLDREDIDHYELLIEALDQGSPRRSSQTLVKIIVDDVNDEAPKIEVPLNKMIYVAKTGSALSIGTIIASDRDEKEVLTYQLLGENYSAANFCFNKGLCMIWNKGTLSKHK